MGESLSRLLVYVWLEAAAPNVDATPYAKAQSRFERITLEGINTVYGNSRCLIRQALSRMYSRPGSEPLLSHPNSRGDAGPWTSALAVVVGEGKRSFPKRGAASRRYVAPKQRAGRLGRRDRENRPQRLTMSRIRRLTPSPKQDNSCEIQRRLNVEKTMVSHRRGVHHGPQNYVMVSARLGSLSPHRTRTPPKYTRRPKMCWDVWLFSDLEALPPPLPHLLS